MEVIPTSTIPWSRVVHNARNGLIDRKHVREAEVTPGVGYGCDLWHYLASDESFSSVRHRHDFDQIRFAIDGTMDFGQGQICQPGWIAYFPAGAFYGPQKIDEASIFLLQWSDHWVTRAKHDEAMVEMAAVGTFADGLYSYVDDKGKTHKKDPLNAIWEHVFNEPSRFPAPRYDGPILMDPEAFDWVPGPDGLSMKVLGRFTERDLCVYKVRWDVGGATHLLGAERTSAMFTLEGEVSVNEASYGPHAMVWSDLGEDVAVIGEQGAEAICVGLPLPAVDTRPVGGLS